MPTLVFASRNQNKYAEMSAALSAYEVQLVFGEAAEFAEEGASLAENAAIKAVAVAKHSGSWALGDDTGLFVDALQGAPGIHTARYAGDTATASQNREKLLAQLVGVPESQRTAYFECCLAVADPQGTVQLTGHGRVYGLILTEPCGSGGFGYDSLFLIREYRRTLAELTLVTKSVLSHRGRAVQRIAPKVVRLLGNRRCGPA